MNSIIMAVISSPSSNGTQKDTLAQGKLVSPQHSLSNHQGILFSFFSKNLLFYHLKNIWSIQLIYNVILVSGIQQSESVYIYIYIYVCVCVCVLYTYIFLQILFSYRPLQSIEQNSICYTAGSISYLFSIQWCIYVNPRKTNIIYHLHMELK